VLQLPDYFIFNLNAGVLLRLPVFDYLQWQLRATDGPF
jgi:hypothetical protein